MRSLVTASCALALSACGAPATSAQTPAPAPATPTPTLEAPRVFDEPAVPPAPTAPSALAAPPAPPAPLDLAPRGLAAPDAPFRAPLLRRELPPASVATHNATLSSAACRAQLARMKLDVRRVGGDTSGIATPVRLPPTLGGVRFVTAPSGSKYGLLDCRLALTLAELAVVLAQHEVVSIRIDNFYRPRAKLSKRVKSQHHHGLAMDIVSFGLKDGRTLLIERDWQAGVGDGVCGPNAVMHEATDEAVRLRNLVCDVARQELFHHMLSPSYDAAHRDHLHWDIKRKGYAAIVR
ncbi:MAG: extensin family protein [Polyangiaceae bacterium]|nr:extensin family protein [Polyangiaceae bacterium]